MLIRKQYSKLILFEIKRNQEIQLYFHFQEIKETILDFLKIDCDCIVHLFCFNIILI